MKLRIHDNSIRLRLSRPDVTLLCSDGILQSTLRFADGKLFNYSLESSPASVRPTAQYVDGDLRVFLPESMVTDWAGTDSVSIRAEQIGDDGETLRLLIEKDFKCLSPRSDEDESDMYPHPEQGARNC